MRTFLACLALLLLSTGAFCAAPQMLLYNGDAEIDSGGITLEAWGSGYATETYATHYIGPRVIRVLSQGYFQGAVLKLGNPAELGGFLKDSNAYLELWIRPAITPRATGSTAKAKGQPAFLLKRLRVVLVTDKGEMVVQGWPAGHGDLPSGVWARVTIPLSVFKSSSVEPANLLQGLQIFADRADIFYLGQISLLIDSAPLRLTASAKPAKAKVGKKISFKAEVGSGAAAARVLWDFDNRNGIQIDAQGTEVQWIFNGPGTYVVTAIASDVFGTKEPATATVSVAVGSQ
jgi:hypothetical protein